MSELYENASGAMSSKAHIRSITRIAPSKSPCSARALIQLLRKASDGLMRSFRVSSMTRYTPVRLCCSRTSAARVTLRGLFPPNHIHRGNLGVSFFFVRRGLNSRAGCDSTSNESVMNKCYLVLYKFTRCAPIKTAIAVTKPTKTTNPISLVWLDAPSPHFILHPTGLVFIVLEAECLEDLQGRKTHCCEINVVTSQLRSINTAIYEE